MDKEALERIADVAGINPFLAGAVLEELYKLGYRKLPEGKPPIKTDDLASSAEELQGNAQFINSGLVAQIQHVMRESRKAQRNSDIKWYGGKE